MAFKNISVYELKEMMDRNEKFELLDIRENFERDIAHIGGLHMPMGQIGHRWMELDRNVPTVVYCHHGVRSLSLCRALSEQLQFTNLLNLVGGIHAWTSEIDPSLRDY